MMSDELDIVQSAILEATQENMSSYDVAVRVMIRLQDFNFKIVKMSERDKLKRDKANMDISV